VFFLTGLKAQGTEGGGKMLLGSKKGGGSSVLL
jgi:hypothetical protein